jgi:hypothetical protein
MVVWTYYCTDVGNTCNAGPSNLDHSVYLEVTYSGGGGPTDAPTVTRSVAVQTTGRVLS